MAGGGSSSGLDTRKTLTPTVCPRRHLCNPKVVARKTPHRFPPGTAESASPLGEGEERRGDKLFWFERACWSGDHDWKTVAPGSSPGQALALSRK